MGSLVKRIIEKLISKLVGAKVRVGSVQVDLLSGRVRFADIVVSNVKGFHAPYILRFRRAEAWINPLSLLSGKIVITKGRIRDPEAIYEAGLGKNNFSAVLKNIDRCMGSSRRPASGARYQCDSLVIEGGRIHLSAELPPGKTVTLDVPTISLKALGKEGPGLTGQEGTAFIIRHVIGEGLKAVQPGPS